MTTDAPWMLTTQTPSGLGLMTLVGWARYCPPPTTPAPHPELQLSLLQGLYTGTANKLGWGHTGPRSFPHWVPCVPLCNSQHDYPWVPKAMTLQLGHQVNQNTGHMGTQEGQKDPQGRVWRMLHSDESGKHLSPDKRGCYMTL